MFTALIVRSALPCMLTTAAMVETEQRTSAVVERSSGRPGRGRPAHMCPHIRGAYVYVSNPATAQSTSENGTSAESACER